MFKKYERVASTSRLLKDQESRFEMHYTRRILLRRVNVIELIALFALQVAKAKAFATKRTSNTGYHARKLQEERYIQR